VAVGQTQPQSVFEVMARKGELTSQQTLLRQHYAEGLAAYRERRWDDATRAFAAALVAVPGDGPSMVLMARVDAYTKTPPAVDWDGAWQMERK